MNRRTTAAVVVLLLVAAGVFLVARSSGGNDERARLGAREDESPAEAPRLEGRAEASESAAAGHGTLRFRGTLVDSTGRPVSGVTIWFTGPKGATALAETRADGSFESGLAVAGRYRARVDRSEILGTWEAGTSGLQLALQIPHTVIEILVLDAAGHPVPRCTLAIETEGTQVVEVRGGRHAIWREELARRTSLHVTDPRDESGRELDLAPAYLPFLDLEADRTEIRLERARTVEGRVLDDQGAGVPAVPVSATPADDALADDWFRRLERKETAADGSFRIRGVPDQPAVLWVHPHDDWSTQDAVIPTGHANVVVRLTRGGTLRGDVSSPSGEAVSDAHVLVAWPGMFGFRMAWTDSAGSFRIPGLPEDIELSIGVTPPRKRGLRAKRISGVLAGETPIRISLELGSTIEGVVVAPEGEAPSSGIIVFRSLEADGTSRFHAHTWNEKDRGHFLLQGLPPGPCTLHARPSEGPFAPSEEMTVTAPAEGLRVLLSRGNVLRGRVVDPGGANWSVQFGEQAFTSDVSADGSFQIDGVRDATSTLFVRSMEDDRFGLVEGVRPTEGPFEVHLTTGLDVEGRIERPAEVPPLTTLKLARGTIELWAQILRDGRFRFRGVPPGQYGLWLESNAQDPVLLASDVAAGMRDLVVSVPR